MLQFMPNFLHLFSVLGGSASKFPVKDMKRSEKILARNKKFSFFYNAFTYFTGTLI
jgi:hypothetical protein